MLTSKTIVPDITMHPPVKIVYQDSQIMVIDKPPCLLSSKIDKFQKSLEDIFGPLLVHRLDKDTSGLLVIAKDQSILESLQEQFKSREVKKEYLALVHGLVTEAGLIDVPIAQNPKKHDQFVVASEGRIAATKYEPVNNFQRIFNDLNQTSLLLCNKAKIKKLEKMRYNQFTLLKCQPITGRTHQIRVHLKYINHTVVSDSQYAGRKIYKLDKMWCPRQFLHAAKIGFSHPGTGKWVEFESPLPEDLEKALEKLDVRG